MLRLGREKPREENQSNKTIMGIGSQRFRLLRRPATRPPFESLLGCKRLDVSVASDFLFRSYPALGSRYLVPRADRCAKSASTDEESEKGYRVNFR